MTEASAALLVIAVTAICGAVTAFANVILSLLAKIESARDARAARLALALEAAERREDSRKVQVEAEGIRIAALQTAKAIADIKATAIEAAGAATEKLDEIVSVTSVTHKIVNSNSIAKEKLIAELSRWKANKQPSIANNEDADIAEKTYNRHLLAIDAEERNG